MLPLWFMCAAGPMGAATRAPVGSMLATPATCELLRDAMAEVVGCGIATGHIPAPRGGAAAVAEERLAALLRGAARAPPRARW